MDMLEIYYNDLTPTAQKEVMKLLRIGSPSDGNLEFSPLFIMEAPAVDEDEAEALAQRAYSLYKDDWCARHGYRTEDADEESGFGGELYVCFEEFSSAEFLMADYMKELLAPEDYWLWTKIHEDGGKGEPI